jgi:hypothetical protein
MAGMDDRLVGLIGVEMEDVRLAVVDPDHGVIVPGQACLLYLRSGHRPNRWHHDRSLRPAT